ncbi:hypothetical protein L3V82_06900 [Thiotrichales bacterium 19S3-7]|nr:hypothetical protein [Thiotrichales bacterium 19S3-7]MCF6801911.1 hypothetical protein [Thiotrichales bacterium 19S3-11]
MKNSANQNNNNMDKRIALGIACIYFILTLSCYSIVAEFLKIYHKINSHTIFTTIIGLIILAIIYLIMIKQMKIPLYNCGFNLKNWKSYTVYSIIVSIIFCLFMTLIKYLFILNYQLPDHPSVFEFGVLVKEGLDYHKDPYIILLYILGYSVFVPIQSFIANGALQSVMIDFIKSKYASIISIFSSAIFFAAIHTQLDIIYAIAMFLPGFLWAYIYAKQRSLLGVSISHIIVGNYAFFVLGFDHFIAELHYVAGF